MFPYTVITVRGEAPPATTSEDDTMATATFIEKSQNWQEETTTYWFELNGEDYGTGIEFDGETFGIAESGPDSQVVDSEGAPLTDGDHQAIAVRNTVEVTDEMRAA